MDSVDIRGSLWNRWDPHIHAPGTILSDQYKGSDPWEEFLSRIENSIPPIRALGITDYYNVSVYELVVEKKRSGRLKNTRIHTEFSFVQEQVLKGNVEARIQIAENPPTLCLCELAARK